MTLMTLPLAPGAAAESQAPPKALPWVKPRALRKPPLMVMFPQVELGVVVRALGWRAPPL